MWNDVRFAVRTLGRAPLFAGIAILSLALGIGANTAIFSLLDQVLVRSLHVTDPHRLVVFHVSDGFPGSSHSDSSESVFSYPLYRDLRDRSEVFEGVIARSSAPVSVSDGGSSEQVQAELVSGNLFQVLGVTPALGRAIAPSDDGAPGASPVVMLSASYWTKRFGSNPGIGGRKIVVNGHPMVVIGVAPPGFRGLIVGNVPDLFVPIAMKREITPTWFGLDDRRTSWLNVFGRLKPGISAAQAKARTGVLFSALLDELLRELKRPRESRLGQMLAGLRLDLLSAAQGVNELKREFESALVALMGMVGLVLLIACANVAGLVTARASTRQKEIAVRLALGANRRSLVRQLLIESVMLALVGGLVGLLIASWTIDGLLSLMGPDMEGALTSGVDARLLLFNLALSVVTGLLFGLVPALQSTRPQVAGVLKDQATSVASGTGQTRFRRALVVSQVALSLLLLVAAGLFGRSVANLMRVDPGFRASGVLTFSVNPTLQGYPAARVHAFYRELQQRLRNAPGVDAVGAVNPSPLTNSSRSGNFTIEGYQAKDADDARAAIGMASADYFKALRVPVVQGRELDDQDILTVRKVAVINEAFVRKYSQGRPLLGRHVAIGSGNDIVADREIVGIVRDFKHNDLREQVSPAVFFPFPLDERPTRLTFYIRSTRSESELASAVRRIVRELDPNLPVFDLKPLGAYIDAVTTTERLIAVLAAAFGLLATVLAAVGLYGVIAFIVQRRTPEIGVRVALGARPGEVLALVMREVGILLGVGVVVGLAVALVASRYVESQLFGLGARDPLVFLAALIGLVTVGLAAGLIPARRAAVIDPIRALRNE
ncbi:MAG TPA: ABC transporter permease [Vicinamibacterales bacterium]|jgi:predicted permease